MTYVRLDDAFADHPKIVGLGATALAVHVWALCYCARHLTDGLVDLSATKGCPWVSKRSALENALGRLEGAGLWEREAGGWRIHDYLEYNPNRAQVLEKRRLASERQARWREKVEQRRNGRSNASTGDAVDASPSPAPKGAGREERRARPLGGALIVNTCASCGGEFEGHEDAVFCSDDCETRAVM